MRIFQNSGIYNGYIPRLRALTRGITSFNKYLEIFLNDRFGACHFLLPVLNKTPNAFFTNGDDEILQRLWAKEQGMPLNTSLTAILVAQIEHHRTEVFYNLDPMRYSSNFIKKLPSCVKQSIAWRAAPSPGADFSAYEFVVCNFPSILDGYKRHGWRTAYFSPAYDPVMGKYANRNNRPIDVLFVGSYSRHHARRVTLLENISRLQYSHKVVYCLDASRLTKLSESSIGRLLPLLSAYRRPLNIEQLALPAVFGLQLYELLSQAKIVINGAIDMAGNDRGNMRCFEAMGCGALLVSDEGLYPVGMKSGKTILTYKDSEDAVDIVSAALNDFSGFSKISSAGQSMVSNHYSKSRQWEDFVCLVS